MTVDFSTFVPRFVRPFLAKRKAQPALSAEEVAEWHRQQALFSRPFCAGVCAWVDCAVSGWNDTAESATRVHEHIWGRRAR
jgi:hypothetical protein